MILRDPRYGQGSRDYLLVRLRCRRSALRRENLPQPDQPGHLRQVWRRELAWVYDHLPAELVRSLTPVFVYEEIRLLLLALRFLSGGDRAEFALALQPSLLRGDCLKQLLRAADTRRAIVALEQTCGDREPLFRGGDQVYLDQGPGGYEQQLLLRVLQQGRFAVRPRLVRDYFACLIDMRNLIGLEKHLRWQIPHPPDWVQGGRLGWRTAQAVWQSRDRSRLGGLARQVFGTQLPAGSNVESGLWQGLGRQARGWGRDPLGLGVLLDYLVSWQLWIREQALTTAHGG